MAAERLLQVVSDFLVKREKNSIQLTLKMRFSIPGKRGLKKRIDLPNAVLRLADEESVCQFSVTDRSEVLTLRF